MLTTDLLTFFAYLVPLVELLGIIMAVHAVMRTRTSQGAIAWVISLVTFPWVTLPLYAVFGRNRFNGYVRLRNLKNREVHHIIEELKQVACHQECVQFNVTESRRAMVRLANLPVMRYNTSELLINGQKTFTSIFAAMEKAGSYILVQFFIVEDDELGRKLKDLLIRKAKEGVRIYFLYDEIGSHNLPPAYPEEMETAGIIVSPFHTTKGKANRFQINFRNHRKIVVIDGTVGFVGGHNVGDQYVSKHCKFGSWRDTHVRVEGPIVKAIQFCFVEDWHWARGGLPENLDWRMTRAVNGAEDMLMIASGPADVLDTCGLLFVQAINAAKERIWIASPYFVPDQQVLAALKLAALRGVDVRILLPQKPDHYAVYLASFSFYQEILPLGIRLYRYMEGFMHQKVILIDATCAAVGTANMDNRSFRLNFELMLFNYSQRFIIQVEDMLRSDLSKCRLVTLEDYTKRSFFFKLAVRTSALVSPIL
ncbi:MAG: cardiolipin synthase [Desulfoplanes sp.]|nr:cardiolipin synthase [Desulfoplanes sp.]